MRVAEIGGEEFEKTHLRAFAGGGNQRRRRPLRSEPGVSPPATRLGRVLMAANAPADPAPPQIHQLLAHMKIGRSERCQRGRKLDETAPAERSRSPSVPMTAIPLPRAAATPVRSSIRIRSAGAKTGSAIAVIECRLLQVVWVKKRAR